MEIKVYGPGCGKCNATYDVVEKVLSENKIPATLTKVSDIMEMMQMDILATPSVAIDGKIVFKGKVPSSSEMLDAIKAAYAPSCSCGGNC